MPTFPVTTARGDRLTVELEPSGHITVLELLHKTYKHWPTPPKLTFTPLQAANFSAALQQAIAGVGGTE